MSLKFRLKGLIITNKTLLSPRCLGVTSGALDERSNIVNKGGSHGSYHLGDDKVLGAMCHTCPRGTLPMDADEKIYNIAYYYES